jgi:hypothetical protein
MDRAGIAMHCINHLASANQTTQLGISRRSATQKTHPNAFSSTLDLVLALLIYPLS